MTAYIQIQWTTDDIEEAKKIATYLIKNKWVACANIIPNITSIYSWEGQIQEEHEVKVLLKTREENFPKIRDYIIDKGSYDVPEVAKILIDESNPEYTKWLHSITE